MPSAAVARARGRSPGNKWTVFDVEDGKYATTRRPLRSRIGIGTVSSNSVNNPSFQLAQSPSSFNLNFGRLRCFLDDERGRFQRPLPLPFRNPTLQIDGRTDHSLSRIGLDSLVLIETSLSRALQVGIDGRGPFPGGFQVFQLRSGTNALNQWGRLKSFTALEGGSGVFTLTWLHQVPRAAVLQMSPIPAIIRPRCVPQGHPSLSLSLSLIPFTLRRRDHGTFSKTAADGLGLSSSLKTLWASAVEVMQPREIKLYSALGQRARGPMGENDRDSVTKYFITKRNITARITTYATLRKR